MPCSPTSCPSAGNPINLSGTGPNFDTQQYGTGLASETLAHMGWVGFVVLNFDSTSSIGSSRTHLRVTGADLNLKQEVTTPDVIDGRVDRTVYQLGPKLVDGTLNIPMIADLPSSLANGGNSGASCQFGVGNLTYAGTLMNNIWDWASIRDTFGRMCNYAGVDIRYANHAAFSFDKCLVNTLTMNVAQSDLVSWDINVIGRSRNDPSGVMTPSDVLTVGPKAARFLSPARVMTWNDVTINAVTGCTNRVLFYSNMVRNFSLEVNNHIDRYYTLNGSLFPVDINAGKREVTGSLTLLGMIHELRKLAQTNQDRFSEQNELRLAYYIGNDTQTTGTRRDWTDPPTGTLNPPTGSIFAKRLASTIFQIEEVSMTNEVLETTVNYLSLASDKNEANYEFTVPGTSCGYPAWGQTS